MTLRGAKGRRGVVLLNVLMLLLMLLIATAMMMQISFGRTFAVAQHRRSWATRMVAEQVYVAMQACLASYTHGGTLQAPNGSCSTSTSDLTLGSWGGGCGGGCRRLTGSTTLVGKTYNFQVRWYNTESMEIECIDCM